MLIDSHTHIYLPDFEEKFDDMIDRARKAGVDYFLLPNIDAESIDQMHRCQDRLVGRAFPMMGLHPCSVKEDVEAQLEVVKRHLFQPVRKYWAVGEIGIDLYWDASTLALQVKAFEQQIAWAKALDLPIVIHVRNSFDETFEVVDRLHDERLRGVFHCFTGTEQQAQHIADYGTFKMGLGGVLTFKNGKIDQFIHKFDPSLFILETDAPYLAPTPFRGKQNEPSYMPLVARKMAECFSLDEREIEKITTQNCIELFQLNLPHHEADRNDHPEHLDDA